MGLIPVSGPEAPLEGAWVSPLYLSLCIPFRLRTCVPAASSPPFPPLEWPVLRTGPASMASLGPHLAEHLCFHPYPVREGRGQDLPEVAPQQVGGDWARVHIRRPVCGSHLHCHLQDGGLLENLVEASPPMRGCRECRDSGHPAPCLLLLKSRRLSLEMASIKSLWRVGSVPSEAFFFNAYFFFVFF